MKNMTNIYKHLSLLLLVCFIVIQGWGQGVTGNKYENYELVVDGFKYIADEDNRTSTSNTYSNALDGNTDNYWQMNEMKNDGKAWLVVDLGATGYQYLESVTIYLSNNSERHPANVYLYVSSTETDGVGNGWGDAIASQTDVSNSVDDNRACTLSFTTPLAGRYMKVEFEGTTDPADDGGSENGRARVSEIKFNYSDSYIPETLDCSTAQIKHKPAKWYEIFEQSSASGDADSFDESGTIEPKMIDAVENSRSVQLQNTHTLVDTLYVKKGKTIRLTVPDWLGGTANNRTYQRWYNYETGGTFATGDTGTEVVNDLLTPAAYIEDGPENGIGYRFANGYIGCPLSSVPLYTMDFYYSESGTPDHYKIACDVSGYNDFTEHYSSESKKSSFLNMTEDGIEAYEPTLSHRFIFYIIAVNDEMPPVDVKNITLPATRIPNETEEMVALSRDAQGYTIPSNTADEEVSLTVTIENNGAGISFIPDTEGEAAPTELTLSGDDRIIHFAYATTEYDNTKSVEDGSTASIVVKNGTTEVARFNLTFVEQDRLLSQTQVKLLNDDTFTPDESVSWQTMKGRTPQSLNDNYELLTELNFDYEKKAEDAVGNQEYVYPFPLLWSSSTYGFYDGSVETGDFVPHRNSDNELQEYPAWGYYGVIRNYLEGSGWGWGSGLKIPDDTSAERLNSEGDESTYHLYADVSDRPGVIARLPFERQLCAGTELLVTAWVKSARSNDTKQNAGALFTIMGVTEGEDGQKTYTPIYRYQTGQIPTTNFNDYDVNLPGFNGYAEGGIQEGAGLDDTTLADNEWMQAYFSFINKTDRTFDSYALQIDNNSASTDGGDIYIDDIRVYIAPANPDVTQLSANCDDEKVRLNVGFGFERLLSRIGALEVAETSTEQGVDRNIAFCLIDKDMYDDAIETGKSAQEAIKTAKTFVYASDSETVQGSDYMDVKLSTKFSENTACSPGAENALPTADGEDLYIHRRTTDNGSRLLTMDFYADVKANHTYYILVANPDAIDEKSEWMSWFEGFTDQCAIRSEFTVTPQNMLRVNGEIVDPDLTYCANETFNFTAELRVPTGEIDAETGKQTYEPLDADVYFDWFFGTEDDYIKQNSDYGNLSLEDALSAFRGQYSEAGAVEDAMYEENKVSEDVLNIIKYYSEEAVGAAEGQHAHPLVLHAKTLNITLLNEGLKLIAQPIRTTVDEENICWNYIPLTLKVTNTAPSVKPGFNSIRYTDEADNLDPSLRIGLDQIKSVATGGEHSLEIDLRDANYSGAADGLRLIEQETDGGTETLDSLYLVSTDDPEYAKFFVDGDNFDQYSLPVGKITSFAASHYGAGTTTRENLMTLQFDLTTKKTVTMADGTTMYEFIFAPKEGYTYNLAVHFEEKSKSGEGTTTACKGHFILPIKVVPKYVKWNGPVDGSGNWNNDGNWKRVSSTDVKKSSYQADDYMSNGLNGNTEGFVPMLFTKVIMPKNSKVRLYRAGYNNDSWGLGADGSGNRPEDITQDPTLNIQYDLMAYGNESSSTGDIKTQLYRVNVCDEIHFEEDAEMLRTEYLLYNKAWIDVKVPAGAWTLVATPLQSIVAGDWYTQTTGLQATEYFTDITFTSDYNRLNPYVAQRGWGQGAQVVGSAGGSGGLVSFGLLWSSLFNDTSIPYCYGNGYSVKTSKSENGMLFRFPKADASFDYSSATIKRENSGRLATDKILKREVEDAIEANNALENESFNVTLSNVATGSDGTRYAIVGNPFVANLDVKSFLEGNADVLEQKYWITNTVEGPVIGSADSGGNWIETGFGQVKPYQAFYVQLKANAETEVKFTPAMAVLPTASGATSSTASFVIKAQTESGVSSATLAYSPQADNGYEASEDAFLLTDMLGNGDNFSVYTVAGNTAVSANNLKDARQVPLGLFADDNDVATLTFTGVSALLEPSLYDAETNTDTPLTEGYTLMVDGASHGRYFIRAKGSGAGTTGIDDIGGDGDNGVSVYSVAQRQVIVSSGADLLDVAVYSVGGSLLCKESILSGRTTCTLNGVDSGVAIVRVRTVDGVVTRKVTVR